MSHHQDIKSLDKNFRNYIQFHAHVCNMAKANFIYESTHTIKSHKTSIKSWVNVPLDKIANRIGGNSHAILVIYPSPSLFNIGESWTINELGTYEDDLFLSSINYFYKVSDSSMRHHLV